jgi:3-oxoacyl-[acyl-carrier-protein] synthase II
MRPASISSAGCACALGIGAEQVVSGLRSGRDGIVPVDLFSVEGCRASTAGQFPRGLRDAASGIHSPARHWSRAAQAFLVVVAEAIAGRPGFVPDVVIVGTTSGPMTWGEDFFRAWKNGGAAEISRAARRVRGYPPGVPVVEVLEALGIRAPVRVISNACASGTNALGAAWQMVRSGRAKRVLAGGYDVLAQLVFAGFDCLQAAAPSLCRPFDAAREGLALGEGAAAFCVEEEGAVQMLGYGASTDTHHLTQPHPSGSGPLTAMRRALENANLAAECVSHVNAHGTGTPQNDACEAKAIAAVCPHAAVTSTKAMTGHTLGAAGAIEAFFSMASLQGAFIPPTLNFRSPDEGVELDIVTGTARPGPVPVVLSNSFGFGGANASLLLTAA